MAMSYGGIMYFPLNVSFFEDAPIELIEAKCGLAGIAAVMKLLCKMYKEKGYYLLWGEEQCTLFSHKAGIEEESMKKIVDILIEKGFFDRKCYEEQHALTSVSIQKVWLEATKRRKKEVEPLPYFLIKIENKHAEECMQNQRNCIQDADISPENADNREQSKVKHSRVEESKVLPPLTPPGEDGGEAGDNSALKIPEYAYSKQTHNLECLMLSLRQLNISSPEEIRKILRLCDYGRLGNPVWRIINSTHWSTVNSKGSYIIAALAKGRKG